MSRRRIWAGLAAFVSLTVASTSFADDPPAPAPVPQDAPETAVAAFRTFCAGKAAALEKSYAMTAVGKDGWMFFGAELRHLGLGTFWGPAAAKASQSLDPENADPLPAIVDFKEQLEKKGIKLLLVPVPPKAVIYPEKAWPQLPAAGMPPSRLDTGHRQFYALLQEKGVDVLDLTPTFLTQRNTGTDPLYCKQDTHWSGRATVLTSQILAARLKNAEWVENQPKQPMASTWKRIAIKGDLWQSVQPKPAQETLPLRFAGTANPKGLPKPLPNDSKSPILLLGDSHTLVFHEGGDMHTTGAGLADQLALELGFPVDLIGVRGSGATPARINLMRKVKANAQYLGHKKLVIWCFSAREFTETMGWNKVPVTG